MKILKGYAIKNPEGELIVATVAETKAEAAYSIRAEDWEALGLPRGATTDAALAAAGYSIVPVTINEGVN